MGLYKVMCDFMRKGEEPGHKPTGSNTALKRDMRQASYQEMLADDIFPF